MRVQRGIYRAFSLIMTLVIVIQCLASNGMYIYAAGSIMEEDEEHTEEVTDIPALTGKEWRVKTGVVFEDTVLEESCYLTRDVTVKGDLEVYDSIQLNGHTLTIEGNLQLRDDANVILDGDLVVEGNIEIDGGQLLFYGKTLCCQGDVMITDMNADQRIALTHDCDKLQISDDFSFNNSLEGALLFQEGILELAGDFVEIRINESPEITLEFGPEFQVILNGEEERQSLSAVSNLIIKDDQEGTSYTVKSIRTTQDTESPVLVEWDVFQVYEGNVINRDTGFSITAKDNCGIESLTIFYALKGTEEWEELPYRSYSFKTEKDKGGSGTIPTSLLRGTYVFRFVITDISGNTTEETEEYHINCQGIEAPVITNRTGKSTSISLEWTMSESADVNYEVQILEGDTFVRNQYVRNKTYATITGLPANQDYTIRIQPYKYSSVYGGSEYGIPSEPVTVTTMEDTEIPRITALRPAPTYVGDKIPLTVMVTDNNAVQSVQLEYSLDKEQWLPIAEQQAETKRTTYTFSCQMDTSGLPEGSIYIRAFAYDYAGNKSQGVQNEYIIDHTPPEGVDDLEAYDID
ncbi:MAG: fibronectin type III domain-containing protein, partial [Lachnospiraceae bacterium]|nr:fibronectin type III domain-containing protein [Lachnospiraceae bacterium]